MNRGLKGRMKTARSFFAAAVTSDQTSAAMDTQGMDSAGFLVQVEAFTFSGSNKIALKMTECDTLGGTYTDVAAEDYEGGAIKELTSAADGGIVHTVGYLGKKRYIKLVMDVTGTVDVDLAVIGLSLDPTALPAE